MTEISATISVPTTPPVIHDNEVRTDAEQVRRLVAAQFPQWAGRPVTPVPQAGTDHLLYRLGDDLVARMPRIEWAIDQAESDYRWLPILAPHLPLPIPVPVAVGRPGEGYPWPWSIAPWLDGENPNPDNFDMARGAVQLAEFITAMGGIETFGGPMKTGTMRGTPLAARDDLTRSAIAELGDRADGRRMIKAWDRALSAPGWSGPPVWIHGDLQAGNLLVRDREMSAVIDFGALGLGDQAVEFSPAWSLFGPTARRIFRAAAACDDDTWERARGWALSMAVGGMNYYWDTAPKMIAEAQRVIGAVLTDVD